MARKFHSLTEILEMFRANGAKGGKTRAANMTAKQRSDSARKAAKARWAKARAEKNNKRSKTNAE
jgi:hypothetical protein